MVFGLIDQGQASLNGLIEQRQRLRGVNRMVFDIGNRLGLSQSTMKIIERRDITDAYLVAGGMIVTILVIYFVWF
jgi:Golgi SNAP receptor complex protein 2